MQYVIYLNMSDDSQNRSGMCLLAQEERTERRVSYTEGAVAEKQRICPSAIIGPV
jgi:hypothetical protein